MILDVYKSGTWFAVRDFWVLDLNLSCPLPLFLHLLLRFDVPFANTHLDQSLDVQEDSQMYCEVFFRCARTLLLAYKVIHKKTTERIIVCVQNVPFLRKLWDLSPSFALKRRVLTRKYSPTFITTTIKCWVIRDLVSLMLRLMEHSQSVNYVKNIFSQSFHYCSFSLWFLTKILCNHWKYLLFYLQDHQLSRIVSLDYVDDSLCRWL